MFCLFTMLSLLPASMLKANCKVIHFSPHPHHSVKEKEWPLPHAAPTEAPPPRRAHAASPSPSCSGKRPKVERWRGVNGLANNELITVSQTIVGRWPPCHVLQHPSISKRRLSHGGRGAETPVLLFRYLDSSLHLA